MDHQRFDDLTRALAGHTSRRAVLRLLAGGVTGGAVGVAGLRRSAVAKHCAHPGQPCADDTPCCGVLPCVNGFCQPNEIVVRCGQPGQSCTTDADCCGALPCVDGSCQPAQGNPTHNCSAGCGAGEGCCDDVCTPLTTENDCGACGNACAAGETCVDGTCTAGASCQTGISCGADGECPAPMYCPDAACCECQPCSYWDSGQGACVAYASGYADPRCNDPRNPATAWICSNGECVQAAHCPDLCATNEACCNGSCIDITTTENCGYCGLGCDAGLDCCDGNCTDTSSNPAFCGDCATQCESNQACVLGQCATGCLIAGTFYADGESNPHNQCQSCDAAGSTSSWTQRIGQPCQDSNGPGTCCATGTCCIGNENCTCCGPTLERCNPAGACSADGHCH